MERHTFVAYVPVLHEGYLRFLNSREGSKELYIFGPEITNRFRILAKDLRQLDPELVRTAIESLGVVDSVQVLTEEIARSLNTPTQKLILPDEDVSRELANELFPEADVTFESVFLRWDKHNALKERPVVPEEQITHEELHKRMLGLAEAEAKKSPDIWRHVGAVATRNGEVLITAHNAHAPSDHASYAHGDPRNNFHKGDHIELSLAFHAEAAIIAEAARKGISLEGADLYLTVFPCPPCARLVAFSGIKNLYCGGGYGVLDGEEVLKSRGVAIYFVE